MIKRFIQLCIVLLPVGLFFYLLWLDIAPGGIQEVHFEVADFSPYIDRLLPDERVSGVQYNQTGEAYLTILDDPTYFAVHFPQTDFDEVEVEIEFNNPGQPIVELGALQDIYSGAYDLRPLHNLIIEHINWSSISSGEVVLYEREHKFDSIDNFLSNLPPRSEIATYHYDLEVPYRIADYRPLQQEQSFDISLRGYHQYQTYIKDEALQAEFVLMDMNRSAGADEVALRVRNEHGEIVLETELEDDGNQTTNQASTTRTITLYKENLPEGVYSVELSGTSDIFWRQITTTQRYVTFVNRLYIGDDVGHRVESRATEFFTNAKHFTFETFHADAAQRLELGESEILIEQSHEKVKYSVEEAGVVRGYTPVGDIKITADGKFAFSRESFFDPDPVSLEAQSDLDALGVNYLLTTYRSPTDELEWQVASARFQIADIADESNTATFTLSTPAIFELQQTVDIHAINLTFYKKPLSKAEFWQEMIKRLPFGL